jgi:hypothetical protein
VVFVCRGVHALNYPFDNTARMCAALGFVCFALCVASAASFRVHFKYWDGVRTINAIPSTTAPGAVDTQVAVYNPKTHTAFSALGFGPDCNGDVGWLPMSWDRDLLTGRFSRVGGLCERNASSTTNAPGARSGAVWLTVNSEWHLLFAGFGTGSKRTTFEGKLSDAWWFVSTSRKWLYAGGPRTIENVAIYGEQGVSNPSNC